MKDAEEVESPAAMHSESGAVFYTARLAVPAEALNSSKVVQAQTATGFMV